MNLQITSAKRTIKNKIRFVSVFHSPLGKHLIYLDTLQFIHRTFNEDKSLLILIKSELDLLYCPCQYTCRYIDI